MPKESINKIVLRVLVFDKKYNFARTYRPVSPVAGQFRDVQANFLWQRRAMDRSSLAIAFPNMATRSLNCCGHYARTRRATRSNIFKVVPKSLLRALLVFERDYRKFKYLSLKIINHSATNEYISVSPSFHLPGINSCSRGRRESRDGFSESYCCTNIILMRT